MNDMNNQIYQAVKNMALAKLNSLPANQRNSPQIQTIIRAIQNDDHETGNKLATNFCGTYGVTKEEALTQAISMLQQT